MKQNTTLRQQKIVAAARKIITSQGTKNLTVRNIAKELKVTNGALYRHFPNKNGIIKLLIKDIETSLLETIQKAARIPGDPLQKLKNIFLAHLSYTEKRKGSTFLVINETLSLRDKRLQGEMLKVVRQYSKTIEGIFAEGIRSGKFRKDIKPASASIAFFGMIQSLVTMWSLCGFQSSFLNTSLIELFDIYQAGILK